MGLSKQIRKRSNQKIAAPLSTTTMLSPDQLFDVLSEACSRYNQAQAEENRRKRSEGGRFTRIAAEGTDVKRLQYHLDRRPQEILIGYEQAPAWMLANIKRRPGRSESYWLARVRMFRSRDPGAIGCRVEIGLVKWVMDGEGRLRKRDRYEHLTEMLWEAASLQAESPSQGQTQMVLS